MNLSRFNRCSLEVKRVDDRELDRSLRERASRLRVGQKMVRKVCVSIPYDHPLESQGVDGFLAAADHCLQTVAASIGASVVGHEWCLLPIENDYLDGQLARLGLPGFDLGAEVEVVSGNNFHLQTWRPYMSMRDTLVSASLAYFREHGYHIADIASPNQYLADFEQSVYPKHITLVDIEPRVIDYIS